MNEISSEAIDGVARVFDRDSSQRSIDAKGFARANKLRREHNGIFGVHLFLGRDGHNECKLIDYNGTLGEGESGRSVLEAVDRAVADCRRTRFLKTGKTELAIAIDKAIERFGPGQPVFSAAGIQQYFRADDGWMPTGEHVAIVLRGMPEVVQLRGGCHWYLLPEGLKRHVPPDPVATN